MIIELLLTVLGTIGHVDHGKVQETREMHRRQELTEFSDHIDGRHHEKTGREGIGKLPRIWRD